MKISRHKSGRKTIIDDVEIGQPFTLKRHLYLRSTSPGENIKLGERYGVDMTSGIICVFPSDQKVMEVDAKVVLL